MTLHPHAREMLKQCEEWQAQNPAPRLEQSRQFEEWRLANLGGPLQEIRHFYETEFNGVPVRVYVPRGEPIDIIVWVHGGGWVAGSAASADDVVRAIANASQCTVVSVDYRLAPEHPYPAGLEDCDTVLSWVDSNMEALGASSHARLAVAGDSAGGNIAAALTLAARDRGLTIDAQLLFYPVLSHCQDTGSYESFATGYGLGADDMKWHWEQYVPDEHDPMHYLISPLHGELSDLPPAVIVTAGCDILHDEGQQYADRLRSAGVAVRYFTADGLPHGFLGSLGVIPEGVKFITQAGEELHKLLRALPTS